MNRVSAQLDDAIEEIRRRIPDVETIVVGRELIMMGREQNRVEPPSWVVTISVPRRDRRFRILRGKFMQISVSGDTLESAIVEAWRSAFYHATGSLPE